MQRVSTDEILDSDLCPAPEVEKSLRDLCRMNRWFGGVSTTRKMVERVVSVTGKKHFEVLDIAAGLGEVPKSVRRQLEPQGINLDLTCLDRLETHLCPGDRSLVSDALALPFRDASFDLVTCSLFAHHLDPQQLARFGAEAFRVSRVAVLINDLIRHPLHLALIYAGFPLMRSSVSRADGVASVKQAYVPEEMRNILCQGTQSPENIEITRNFLFRMGVIVWKQPLPKNA